MPLLQDLETPMKPYPINDENSSDPSNKREDMNEHVPKNKLIRESYESIQLTSTHV